MITEPAMLCSLRARPGRAANRLSNSCTLVVSITGAAQCSIASRSLSRLARSLSIFDWSSMAE